MVDINDMVDLNDIAASLIHDQTDVLNICLLHFHYTTWHN